MHTQFWLQGIAPPARLGLHSALLGGETLDYLSSILLHLLRGLWKDTGSAKHKDSRFFYRHKPMFHLLQDSKSLSCLRIRG